MTYYLIYLSIAFFITTVSVYPVKKLAKNYHIVSIPNPQISLRNREIPYLAGVALYLGFIVTLITFFYIKFPDQEINVSLGNPKFVGIIIAAMFVTFSGLIHDVYPYNLLARISLQIVAIFILAAHGVVTDFNFWLQHSINIGTHSFSTSNLLFTVVWMLVIINSFDMLDIFDSLLIHVSIIICLFFFLSALTTNQYENAFLLSILIGCLLGLFIEQVAPSKILLGKAGTYFLGLIFAIISVEVDYSSSTSTLAPFILLLFPISFFCIRLFIPKQKIISLILSKINEEKIVFHAVLYNCIFGVIFYVITMF